MALEDILAAISAESDAEIARIGGESAEEIAAVLDRGRAEASAVEEEAARSLEEDAVQERERIVNRARLQVERRLRAAIEDVYLGLRREAGARLAEVRDSPRYPELFRRLFDECRAILPDASTLLVDPADLDLVRDLQGKIDLDGFTIDPTLSSLGGLEFFTEDRRRGVRNTLESRLKRADPHLRSVAVSTIPALRGGT